MSASMTVIQSVEIKDPTLLNFHTQRENAFKKTEEEIKSNFSTYQQHSEALDAFAKRVRHEGKLLQEQTIETVPSKEELEKQKELFLGQHAQYKASCEKIKEFATNIKRTIEFLEPSVRNYVEEKSLKEGSPELYKQTKYSEEICLTYVRELKASHESVVNLQKRMCTTLTGSELSWSLQRFCAIVDNNGNPLPWYARTINYVTTPVVPKSVKISESAISEEGQGQSHAEIADSERIEPKTQVDDPSITPPSTLPNNIPNVDISAQPDEIEVGAEDNKQTNNLAQTPPPSVLVQNADVKVDPNVSEQTSTPSAALPTSSANNRTKVKEVKTPAKQMANPTNTKPPVNKTNVVQKAQNST